MDLYLGWEIDMTISMLGIDIAKNTCAWPTRNLAQKFGPNPKFGRENPLRFFSLLAQPATDPPLHNRGCLPPIVARYILII